MTRLIDADAFIKEARNRIDMQDLYLPVHIKEMVLDEMPKVDAVPVSFIQQRIDELAELAEFEFESSGGYTGKVHTEVYALRRLINYWKAEQSAKDK